jgi:hypothetical protein
VCPLLRSAQHGQSAACQASEQARQRGSFSEPRSGAARQRKRGTPPDAQGRGRSARALNGAQGHGRGAATFASRAAECAAPLDRRQRLLMPAACGGGTARPRASAAPAAERPRPSCRRGRRGAQSRHGRKKARARACRCRTRSAMAGSWHGAAARASGSRRVHKAAPSLRLSHFSASCDHTHSYTFSSCRPAHYLFLLLLHPAGWLIFFRFSSLRALFSLRFFRLFPSPPNLTTSPTLSPSR